MKLKVDVVGQDLKIDRVENEDYLLYCAALSFHKSLVGVSELRAIESFIANPLSGGLRISRAMSTYYTIYHLFICMILLDENYILKVKTYKKEKNEIIDGYLDIKVLASDINNELETPEIWNNASKLEQDIATRITHTQVKDYCEYLRENTLNTNLLPPFKVLYEHFVEVLQNPYTSKKGLFEKICYIRDRVLYRPSYVIGEDNGFIHTSAHLKTEVDHLLKSGEIYTIIKEIYHQIIQTSESCSKFKKFIWFLWSDYIDESEENVKILGFTDEDINRYRAKSPYKDQLSFSTYITHLMELVERERLSHDYDSFWSPLFEMTSLNNSSLET